MKCLYCGQPDCEEIERTVKELEERIKVIAKKLDWDEWVKANPDVDENEYFNYLFDDKSNYNLSTK
jgi:hypothetical protein